MSLVRARLDPFRFQTLIHGRGVGGSSVSFLVSVQAITQNPTLPPPQLIKSGGHVIAEQLLKVTINTYLTLKNNLRSTISEEVIYRHGVLNLYLYI